MTKYPNLEHAKRLSVDIETHDPELKNHGPGVYRKDGHILGVAISDGQGFKEYYNFGHEDGTKAEKDANKEYVKSVLALPNEKLFANGLYDLDWLQNSEKYGYKVGGKWHDILIAEPLLDENRYSYSLDALSEQYLGYGKQKSEIDIWCKTHGLKGDPRQHLWRMPYSVVREYAIGDSEQTFQIFDKQLLELEKQELLPLYNIEMGCIPLLLRMRKVGVRIDRARLDSNINYLQEQIRRKEHELFEHWGGDFNYKSMPQMREKFKVLGIDIPKNIEGKESFDKDSLKSVDHPIAEEILACRALKTSLGFLVNSFHANLVGERIHCTFNPLRSDAFGTVSGRLSGSNPNLQQVTGVDDDAEDFDHDLGVLSRGIFIPEHGCAWDKDDYSQIEYRFIAHYADGPRASEIRKEYNEKPDTDYHQLIMDWTGLARKDAKRLNFGVAYSMGAKKMAYKFGWTIEKAYELVQRYHDNVPFVKYTSKQVIQKAEIRDIQTKGGGYIKTILGRRARISDSMRREKRLYSLFNRMIQGSAADKMKKAMYDAWNAGVFEVLYPHLTVHDELDYSRPLTEAGEEAAKELKYIMENAIKLKVPVVVKRETGPDWAHLKEVT